MCLKILLIDDEEGLRTGLSKFLSHQGYTVLTAANTQEGRARFADSHIDVVLLDLNLKGEQGMDLLEEFRKKEPELPVIIITGYGDVKSAVECMKHGASNFLSKPLDHELLISVLEKECTSLENRQEAEALRVTAAESARLGYIRSRHDKMRKVDEVVDKVKDSSATVLIRGETGTGKEITARKIHFEGKYRERPFISVNCAALNDNLLESELFGHEKGAFTGAYTRKTGRFELAGRGTLFLDEVGDMSVSMQSKLLRVLQERVYERVGGTRALEARCRIIAATNKNLEEMIREGEFREDLYYRLSVVTLQMPALRDRREDIPALVSLFIECANREYEKQVEHVSPDLMHSLKNADWPGNIRQLKNVITNAVLLSEGQSVTDIPLSSHPPRTGGRELTGSLKHTVEKYTDELEQELIRSSLKNHDYVIARAAKELQISRKTLYEKMERYGL